MSGLKTALFYSPSEVARIFGKPPAWAYRHATGSGCLVPYARRLGRQLFFLKAAIDRLAADEGCNIASPVLPSPSRQHTKGGE